MEAEGFVSACPPASKTRYSMALAPPFPQGAHARPTVFAFTAQKGVQ
jgi:hypothetical protein